VNKRDQTGFLVNIEISEDMREINCDLEDITFIIEDQEGSDWINEDYEDTKEIKMKQRESKENKAVLKVLEMNFYDLSESEVDEFEQIVIEEIQMVQERLREILFEHFGSKVNKEILEGYLLDIEYPQDYLSNIKNTDDTIDIVQIQKDIDLFIQDPLYYRK
jgi:hypothetical protein